MHSTGLERAREAGAISGPEVARLEVLRQYDLMDTPAEPVFDDIARLAAQVCRTPIAVLSMVDEAREYVKARCGWEIKALARPDSLAAHLLLTGNTPITSDSLLLVTDAREDARLQHNLYVTGEPRIRFYAAVPLVSPEGFVMGVLSVMDTHPRLLNDTQADDLRLLARQVMAHLESRRRIAELLVTLSSRSRAEEAATWQAHHDVLTGLPNRKMFLERVDKAVKTLQEREANSNVALAAAEGAEDEATRGRRGKNAPGAAVLFVDLDRFKRINDTLGHAVGDALLREVAARFSGCLRPEDTLARLGGDEFTVLLPNVPTANYAANVSQMLLRTLRRPVLLGAEELHVAASIGIATYPRDGEAAETLLKHADIAMYEAKAKGGYQAYSRRMNADGYQRLLEEGELRRAIDKNELSLCYQPQVEITTGRMVGVEALARWRHPERGLIPPAHFITLAEQADLIVPLGEWVLRKACEDAARWRAAGYPELRVAVNLSARQVAQPRLLDTVTQALADNGLDGSALDLELTETALCANGEATPQTLQSLRNLGIRLFVDDFGTGYSSLAYLRRFAVDALKIDRAFVAGLGTSTADTALVRALIEMAHALELKVVAEGVETMEQWEGLRDLGCDLAQGFLYGRPIDFVGLTNLLVSTHGILRLQSTASGVTSVHGARRVTRPLLITSS